VDVDFSTAKSNPSPGKLVLHSLRDLLARWSREDGGGQETGAAGEALRVGYHDNVFEGLLAAVENLAVVASESMQPHTTAEILNILGDLFSRLPGTFQARADDLIRRILSALGEHVLTAELEAALLRLSAALEAAGRKTTAAEVNAARTALAESIGKLGARSTRVHSRGGAPPK
jgi:hypothetical protein